MRIEGFLDVIGYLEQSSLCRMMLPMCRLKTGKKAMLSKICTLMAANFSVTLLRKMFATALQLANESLSSLISFSHG